MKYILIVLLLSCATPRPMIETYSIVTYFPCKCAGNPDATLVLQRDGNRKGFDILLKWDSTSNERFKKICSESGGYFPWEKVFVEGRTAVVGTWDSLIVTKFYTVKIYGK